MIILLEKNVYADINDQYDSYIIIKIFTKS